MASCAQCGTTILFGGKYHNGLRYCSDACLQNGFAMQMTSGIPDQVLAQQVEKIHRGQCPKCHGRGPVDVHTSYRVWSAFVLTSWNSAVQVSCRSCGIKSQLGNTLFCLTLGWWGLPWGFILTPVQVVRNLVAMCSGPDASRPSAQLEKAVRVMIAHQIATQPPPIPGQS